MRSKTLPVRAIALLGAGSAAIHQLRYAIGYGDGAPTALAAHPHGYLGAALPGVVTALLIAFAAVLMRTAGARRSVAGSPPPSRFARGGSLRALWLGCAIALAAIYGIQETLEGAGALAGSGWIGFALAIPAGLLVALALRGAAAAETLRAPGAALRSCVVTAVPHGMRTLLVRRRVATTTRGARAPPLSFAV